jgi:hypothetical protein
MSLILLLEACLKATLCAPVTRITTVTVDTETVATYMILADVQVTLNWERLIASRASITFSGIRHGIIAVHLHHVQTEDLLLLEYFSARLASILLSVVINTVH